MDTALRACCLTLAIVAGGVAHAQSVTYPSNNTFFQTSGRDRAPTIGDWYNATGTASTERYHKYLIGVTAEQLAAAGGTITVQIGDGESTPGGNDEVTGTGDPTRFQLRSANGATLLATHTFPSGSPDGSSHTFSITAAGTYQLRSETGAFPISGGTANDLNNDDNSFTITINSASVLFGPQQACVQQASGGNLTLDYFFLVGPTASGNSALELRNFDADTNATAITYRRPNGTNVAGTISGDGLWNGPTPTLDTGFDSVTATGTAQASGGDGGVWRFRVSSLSQNNQLIVEAKGDSVQLVLFESTPTAAGNFIIGTNGTLQTLPGTAVDHPFTIVNNFQTNDIVNLSTSGTGAQYSVQLLNAAKNPLTDTDGDGVVDSGIMTPGQTLNFFLRVTPTASALAPDTTRINGVSFMDNKVDSTNNTVRFAERTTQIAAIKVNPSAGLVTTEGGGTATFTVVLNTVPTGNVTFNLSSSDTTEGTIAPASLTFTPGNALVAQNVTITGQDDALIDGPIAFNVVTAAATSTDTLYNNLNPADVSVTNNDNDSPGITVNPTSGLTTTEAGGTASFTIVLNTIPTANVTVGLTTSDASEGAPGVSSVTFSPANALSPVTVTVTGVNDSIDDGDVAYTIVTAPATSTDTNYANLNASDVSVTNTDNDTAGITVTPTSGLITTEAGGTATFTIVLNTVPTANVTVGLSSSDTTEGTIAPASVTFSPGNALTAVTVTLTGVQDAVLDGSVAYSAVTAAATSTDTKYNGINPSDVSVTNTDDDSAGITVSPTSGLQTTEAGGTATFSVVLNTVPTANVTIPLSSSDTSEGTIAPASVTFSPANALTPVTVTLTGVNDAFADGNVAYQAVTGAATSADGAYNNLNASDVAVTNIDNDAAGVTVNPTSGLVTTEAGGTATFTVVLDTVPTANVTLTLSSSDTSEGTVAPANLSFSPANALTPVTVTVTGQDDAIADGNVAYLIVTSTTTSTDPLYNGLTPLDVNVTNTDNDAAGITVTPTSGLVTTEAGAGTATFTIVLDTVPTANVTVGLTSSDTSEGTVAPASVTFSPANATTAVTVTVTGVDDQLVDGNVGYTIVTAPATSTDAAYSALNPSDVTVTNTDNDAAGITVNPTAGLVTTEAGGTATFTIVLDTIPSSNVSVGLSSSDATEGSVAPASVTFSPANALTPVTVTVTGVNDFLVDGNVGYSIVTAAATSADGNYNNLNASDVSVTNTDNDAAGVTVTPTTGLVTTEAGGTATFTIVLDTLPTANVTIALSSSTTAEGTVAPASVTFSPTNGLSPVTVTVTGVDDTNIDGNVAYTIVTAPAVSTDGNYNNLNASDVSVTNNDNDTAGITVTPTTGLVTTEGGGAATFTIVLDTTPTANVVVGLSSSDTTEGTVAPASVTFSPANALTPVTVTVTGQDDALIDGSVAYSIVTAAATSADGNYNNLNASDVGVTNSDNDAAGITVNPTAGLVTTEAGGAATFTIVLDTTPTANVTVGLSSSDTTEGTVAPASVTFSPANALTPVTVTVTGVNDFLVDGNVGYSIVTAAATSADAAYSGLNPSDVGVTNNDNDTAGITVNPTAGLVTTEAGGTATFTIVLDTIPTANVTVGLSSSDTTEGTPAPSSVTFSPANALTAVTVTVTGVNDSVDDGDVAYSIVTAAATSGDPAYNGLNASDVTASNTDDDTAGITVNPTAGLVTTEAGGTATFTIVLNSVPTADVSVGLSSSDATEGTVSPTNVTFSPGNALTPVTVTVTGVDDFLIDGNVAYSVITAAASSSDAGYSGLNPSDVSVTNNDNDAPGITVSPTSGLVTTEAGGTATFTIVLDTIPTANVTIALSSSDTTEGTIAPSSVTFSPANALTPVTVTVTGQDDALSDGSVGYTLVTAPAVSADANYLNRDASDVSATNSDNDTAGITVNPTAGLSTTEAGGTATFTIVLDTVPTDNVTVPLSSSDTTEGTVSPSAVIFSPGNALTPVTVTVTGVDDQLDDGNVAYTIVTAAATSDDANYNNRNASDVSVTNTDNDTAGVTVNPTSGLVTTEAGGTATFTIVLNTIPTANVTIGLSSSDSTEGAPSPTSVTFSPANALTAVTVTVTGADDQLDDGDVAYSILTAAATSADANYSGLNPSDVTVTNTDNDAAGITVNPTAGLVTTEAGGTATFTIVLNTIPTANVTIGLSSNDSTEGTPNLSSVTFSPANALTPVTVTVTGADDAAVDGNVAYSILTAAATSTDPAYNGLNPSDVGATNNDNDTAGITVTPTAGLITTEAGGTATFTIVLDTIPTANVTIGLSSSDATEGAVAPASVTFSPANALTAVTVTLTGQDDALIDGNVGYSIVTAAATSTDANYNGLNPSDVGATNNDNDVVGITVSPTSGLVTTEAGGTATFTIVLNTVPTANVTVGLSSSDTTEGTVSPASVTFSPANATTPVTVTLTGVNDFLIDGNVGYTIVTAPAVSTDATYNGLNPSDVGATNNDNDSAGITVNPTAGLVTTENAGTATFTIVLDTIPAANVRVDLSSSDTTEGTVNPSSVTFSPANALTAVTVTITGVNDPVVDGNVAYSIVTAAAVSGDGAYSGLNPSDVSVTNNDNDTAGITVNPTTGLVTTEAGGTATFTIVLDTVPTANVTVGLSSSDTSEGTVAPSSVVFTPGNALVAQTVTVTGVNDFLIDGDVAYTIVTAAATTADVNYTGLNAADVGVSNTDNDSAGITVNPTTGLVTTEAGGTATFTIALDTIPAANVTIALSSSDTTEGTVSPASVTFSPANALTPVTVTVTGQNDALIDGDVAYSVVTAPAVSTDPNYSGRNASDVGVTNNDNDTAGITVNPTAGLVTTEAGGTATFTIVLNTVPTANVTVGLSSSDTTEGTVSPTSVTFSPANALTPVTVTLTGVNDFLIDGNVTYTIVTAPATSADGNYNNLNPSDVSATNNDNDSAGITVNPTAGLVTTEAGGTATFTIVLDTIPTANVSVGLTSSDTTEGTISPASVTFSPANALTPVTVTITGQNDAVVDGNISYSIVTAAATSADGNYNTLNPSDVSVTNNDNDTAGVTVNPTAGLTTTEAGGTATFTIVLNTVPTGNVTIGLSSDDTTEGAVGPASVTFTPANALTPQTVTVTGVNDFLIDGDVGYSIVTAAANSTDGNYGGLNPSDVSVTNTDNDTAGVTVNPTAGLVTTESGGTATFTIVLNTVPTANVTIGLSSSDGTEGSVGPSVTFTPANALTAQTVTVTGQDDALIDGNVAYTIVTAPATSTDTNYNGLNANDVSVTNNDNDTAGITVNPTAGLVTTEAGGTATFTIVLNTIPTANVTIGLTSSDTTEGTSSASSVVFTPANALTAQTITLTGVNDQVDDGNVAYSLVTAAATSTDANYNGLNANDVSATNTDDDTAGVTVTPTAGLITTEAGVSATFTVVLDTVPTANVTIGLTSSDPGEGTVAPASLTFSPANALTAQTVTVTGIDDLVVDGNVAYTIVTAPGTSADANYSGLDPSNVTVTNNDNDSAGISVNPIAGLVTSEAGGTATFTIVLNTVPTANVTIGLSTSDGTEGAVAPASVTFTPANALTAQTVTVTGVNDEVDDGDVAYTIVTAPATSTDANYSGRNASDVSVTNTDDDTVGITVTPTSGLFTSEAGGTATFTVVLDTQPTANVTINLSSSDATEGSVSPAALTFTPTNGTTAQTVTVTGLDDGLADGDVGYVIVTAPAASTDGNYNNRNASDVSVTNTDNEGPGITVTPTSGLVTTEAGGTATFTVVLNTAPAANVTIGLSSSDTTEGSVLPTTLTFTPANGTVAQTVTVTGVDDTSVDGNVAYTIVTAAAASTDAGYNGRNASDVSVTNNDNDSAGITVTPTTGLVTTEFGGTATYTVRLNTTPSANVTIAVASNNPAEGTSSPATLTFTPANALTPQTVTVTGVDDAVVDGNVAYTSVNQSATSTDANYNGLNPADVALTNQDNDGPTVLVSPTSGLVTTEGGGTATFTVRLSTTPAANVTINLSSSDTSEGTVAPATLTFTPANGTLAQTVTITGVNDAIQDGSVAYTIVTAPAVSADANYSGVDGADVSVTNAEVQEDFYFELARTLVREDAGTAVIRVRRLNTAAAGSVRFVTEDDEATASAPADYSSVTGILTFPAGNDLQTFTVPITDDALVEGPEALRLRLTTTNGSKTLDVSALVILSEAALQIVTASLPGGRVGGPYSQPIALDDGGIGPSFTWRLVSGTLPPGTSLIGSGRTVKLEGTPLQPGTYTFEVEADDDGQVALSAKRSLTITIAPADSSIPPEIASEGALEAPVGEAFSRVFNVQGGTGPYTFSAVGGGPLPPGLSLNSLTGELAGTPTTPGTYTFCVETLDARGRTDATPDGACPVGEEVTIVIGKRPIQITTFGIEDGTVNTTYEALIDSLGGLGPNVTWSITQGSLPPGLTLTPQGRSLLISGTPTTSGVYEFTLQVSDDGQTGVVDTHVYAIRVLNPNDSPKIETISLPEGSVGRPYTRQLTVSGGRPGYTLSLKDGSLPPGLSLDAQGRITGTPTSEIVTGITVQVTDTNGNTSTRSYTLVIHGVAVIKPPAFPPAVVGSGFAYRLETLKGAKPFTWALVGGARAGDVFSAGGLSAGLSLSATSGVIAGSPTSAGTSTFVVELTDRNGNKTSLSLTLEVVSPTGVQALTRRLPTATTDAAFQVRLLAAGGTKPYRWSVASGALPAWTLFDAELGVISGLPTEAGSAMIAFNVTDGSGARAQSVLLQLSVIAPLQLSPPSLPTTAIGASLSQALQPSGGAGAPYTIEVIGGELPPGVRFDSATGTVSGAPQVAGTYSATVRLTDKDCNVIVRGYTLVVGSGPSLVPNLPEGSVNVLYTPTTLIATGGTGPYTYSIVEGSLPPGLSLSPAGEIEGTPTQAGSFTVTFQVVDSTGAKATATVVVVVQASAAPAVNSGAQARVQGSGAGGCSLAAGAPAPTPLVFFLALLLGGWRLRGCRGQA